jgi:hypothetical protein
VRKSTYLPGVLEIGISGGSSQVPNTECHAKDLDVA